MPRKRNMGFRIKPMKHTGLPPPVVLEPPGVAGIPVKLEIESSAVAFESNMLEGDHPLYNHVNKLLGDWTALNDAMNLLRFERNITMATTGEVKEALDAFNRAFREMEVVQTGL